MKNGGRPGRGSPFGVDDAADRAGRCIPSSFVHPVEASESAGALRVGLALVLVVMWMAAGCRRAIATDEPIWKELDNRRNGTDSWTHWLRSAVHTRLSLCADALDMADIVRQSSS